MRGSCGVPDIIGAVEGLLDVSFLAVEPLAWRIGGDKRALRKVGVEWRKRR